MVQLGQFSFNKGGRLVFDSDGRPEVDRHHELDIVECDKRLEQDNPDYMPAYFPSGPYKTAKEFYTSALNRQKPGSSEFLLGQRQLLLFFIDCMDDFFANDRQSFVLAHPDFDIQGDVVGIIDWDGVGAWPKSLGNLRYPGWLTRDWDPGMYGYGSDGVHDPEMREDSPQTLARYGPQGLSRRHPTCLGQAHDPGTQPDVSHKRHAHNREPSYRGQKPNGRGKHFEENCPRDSQACHGTL